MRSALGETCYLDSNILILGIERGHRWMDAISHLFHTIEQGDVYAVTSEITVAEVLAKPLAVGADDLIDRFEQALGTTSPLRTIPIDRGILKGAAELQGRLGIKLIDAIHVATARANGCDSFVTNDLRLGRKLEGAPEWLSLEDLKGTV